MSLFEICPKNKGSKQNGIITQSLYIFIK